MLFRSENGCRRPTSSKNSLAITAEGGCGRWMVAYNQEKWGLGTTLVLNEEAAANCCTTMSGKDLHNVTDVSVSGPHR